MPLQCTSYSLNTHHAVHHEPPRYPLQRRPYHPPPPSNPPQRDPQRTHSRLHDPIHLDPSLHCSVAFLAWNHDQLVGYICSRHDAHVLSVLPRDSGRMGIEEFKQCWDENSVCCCLQQYVFPPIRPGRCIITGLVSVQLGSIIGNNIYRTDDKPQYRRGNSALLAVNILALVLFLCTKVYYIRRNRQRSRVWDGMSHEVSRVFPYDVTIL